MKVNQNYKKIWRNLAISRTGVIPGNLHEISCGAHMAMAWLKALYEWKEYPGAILTGVNPSWVGLGLTHRPASQTDSRFTSSCLAISPENCNLTLFPILFSKQPVGLCFLIFWYCLTPIGLSVHLLSVAVSDRLDHKCPFIGSLDLYQFMEMDLHPPSILDNPKEKKKKKRSIA